MNSRYRAWILALGLLIPITAVGCGSKPAPSPSHTVNKTGNKGGYVTKKDSGNGSSKGHSSAPAAPPIGSVSAGAKLFASTCETCHGKGGTGTANAPRLAAPSAVAVKFKTEAALEAFIAHNMPATNPGSLNSTKAANAAAYVWHLAGK